MWRCMEAFRQSWIRIFSLGCQAISVNDRGKSLVTSEYLLVCPEALCYELFFHYIRKSQASWLESENKILSSSKLQTVCSEKAFFMVFSFLLLR